MKPFSALFGTLKVLDDVEVRLARRRSRADRLGVELEAVAAPSLASRGSGGPPAAPASTSSSKNFSKLPGAMISRIRHGSSPAFQNVCHWLRGLWTRSPGRRRRRCRRAARPCGPRARRSTRPHGCGGAAARRACAGPSVLDEREAAVVGLRGVDHEPDADRAEAAGLAVTRADDLRVGGGVHRVLSLNAAFTDRRYCNISERCVNPKAQIRAEGARGGAGGDARARIAAAAASLHEEVGVGKTTVADIARRADVHRLTVSATSRTSRPAPPPACSAHYLAEHPPPALEPVFALADPVERSARR